MEVTEWENGDFQDQIYKMLTDELSILQSSGLFFGEAKMLTLRYKDMDDRQWEVMDK